MPTLPARNYFKDLDDRSAPFPERAAKLMTYQAALHAMTGRTVQELDPTNTDDDIDTEELERYAEKLRKLGIEDYARRAYGGEDPENVDLKDLKYQYFLYQTLDRLDIPDSMHRIALKESLRLDLEQWEEDREVPCQDHWLTQYSTREEARKTAPKEEDRSVYEFEAPDDVWRDYIACAFTEKGWGARPLTDGVVQTIKTRSDFVFDRLTLRNKRTVEHLKRGDVKAVTAARTAARRSFTFLRPGDLRAAQASAGSLSEQMKACTGDVTRTPEWQKLVAAVDKFKNARDSGTAALASANVLTAVEKFTKGRKNASQSPEVKTCVDLALKSLGTTIPDAEHNPSVKPLVDRFNQVRRHRLQLGSMVTLEGNKALSMNASEQEIMAPWERQVQDFLQKKLSKKTDATKLYGAEPISEADAREHIAIALALEEAREGKLNLRRNQLEGRISELIRDPVVEIMARELSTDAERQEMTRMNAHIFGPYMKQKYGEMKESLRDARRERLTEGLKEMGSDFYALSGYDPEKAKALFAEVLALKEAAARAKPGEVPQLDLTTRIEELKQDPVVEKMAEKLPGDEDFRRIIQRSVRKGESPLEAVSDALSKAWEKDGELPEELRGQTVSDLYAPHRENVKRLAGVLPGARDYTAEQATLLTATLLTIREFELKAGGKDVHVDDDAFGARVEELRKDPTVRNLGSGLVLPKNRNALAGHVSASDEPEKLFAQQMYGTYQKFAPKEQKAPEQPKTEVRPPEEIKDAGDGVPML